MINGLLIVCDIVQVKDYDYYGAYNVKINHNYKYNELLGKEYTFDFPPHHGVVRYSTKSKWCVSVECVTVLETSCQRLNSLLCVYSVFFFFLNLD